NIDGVRLLPGRLAGIHLDFVSADFAQLPSLREYFCRRKHSRRHVAHGASAGLVNTNSVLLFGNPGGVRPGPGLYVVDRHFHALDCATQSGGGSALKFRRSETTSPKPNKKNYDTTTTGRNPRKHSRRPRLH